MKTKITYIGALPDGHVEHAGQRFAFKRGEAIEVLFALAETLEKQSPNDWRTTPAVVKAANEKA